MSTNLIHAVSVSGYCYNEKGLHF